MTDHHNKTPPPDLHTNIHGSPPTPWTNSTLKLQPKQTRPNALASTE
jgi:hypothetical protein